MTFNLWIVNKLFAWTVSSLLLTIGPCHEPAIVALFLDGNCLERRSILVNLKHKVITCFEVQTL